MSNALARFALFTLPVALVTAFASGCAGDEAGQDEATAAASEPVAKTAQALSTRTGYLDIAYKHTATQSSIAYGGDPSRAVDGNTSGVFGNASVTHTNDEVNPWWQVQLSGSRPVSYVTIYNRTDCCNDRLSGAIVELMNGTSVVASKTLATANIPASQDLNFGGAYGTSVRVRLPRRGILSLAEVEVWMSAPTATSTPKDGVCWKDTFGRGVGTIPTECGAGQEKSGLLCYPACSAGYVGAGPVCWETCPAGYKDDGAFCRKDASIISANTSSCPWYDACGLTLAKGCSTCPAGYSNDGCTCRKDAHIFAKKSYGRGVGSSMTCGSGKQYDAGLCYGSCGADYKGVGPVCWEKCAGDYPVECGAACATTQTACAEATAEMVETTLEAIANITEMVLSFGESAVAVSAAKTIAKEAMTVAAKDALKAEIKKQLKAQVKDLAEIELENIAQGLTDAQSTGSFDWTVLDPTGIAAVVNAFNQPKCN